MRNISNQKNEPFSFEIVYQSKRSKARVGRIKTTHGFIDTPGFVPVATNAAIKSADIRSVKNEGLQLLFCNTYHLLIHPGPQIVEEAGGLHKFMNYEGPIITDSGGFQVFSLATRDPENFELKGKHKKTYEGTLLSITEDHVVFRSYRNGEKIYLSPESSVKAQKAFGSDIIIPLDELPAYNVSEGNLEKSFHRTHRWEKRSLDTHLKNPKHQAMYSVIHGGMDTSLRAQSIQSLATLPFDGHAIGGSLGKDRHEMVPLVDFVTNLLPKDKPIHLLGIGDPESISNCVVLGIDTFDSAYPTRLGRHGKLIIKDPPGIIDIEQAKNLHNHRPIERDCTCYTCQFYAVSYLCHLHKTNEISFQILGTHHNLNRMMDMMKEFRRKILNDEI